MARRNKKNKKEKNPMQLAATQVRICAIIAFFSAAFQLAQAYLAHLDGNEELITAYLIVAAVMLVLAIGLLFKSRVCAVLLFAIWLADRVYYIMMGGNIIAIAFMSILWLFIYLTGITAAFKYHRLKAAGDPYAEDSQLAEQNLE